jgi:hypothetical protein
MLEWAKAIYQAIGVESPIRFILASALFGFLLFGGAAWILDRGYRAQLRQEQGAKPLSVATPAETAPLVQRAESNEPKITKLPHRDVPARNQIGNDNTLVNVSIPESLGSGNTFVGATDANGNTILNKGGTAIGKGACADPTSIAIGAGAHAGQCPPPQKAPVDKTDSASK